MVFISLRTAAKRDRMPVWKRLRAAIGIGVCGVAFVGATSGISLLLNAITDEWFACIAFLLLWGYILVRMILQIIRKHGELTFKGRKDWTVLIFWAAMYGYCLVSLFSLGVLQTVPWYGVLAVLLAAGTVLLSLTGGSFRIEGQTG